MIIRADINGLVRIGLSGAAAEEFNFLSPSSILLQPDSNEVDLDLILPEASPASFSPLLSADDLSLFRIDEFIDAGVTLARISQCAQTARITSGGRFHPDSCRFDLVAGKRLGGVTGRVEALRQRPPRAVERSGGP